MHLFHIAREFEEAFLLGILRAVCDGIVAVAVREDGLLHRLAGHLVAKLAVHVRFLLRPFFNRGAGDFHAELPPFREKIRALALEKAHRPEPHCALSMEFCVIFDV